MGLRRISLAYLLVLQLTACGGDSPVSSVTPPAPAPAPLPTPTPAPPPVSETRPSIAPTIRAYASAPVPGEYNFRDFVANNGADGFSSWEGYYYPGFLGQILAFSQATPPLKTSDDFTGFDKRYYGFDLITFRFTFLMGPKDARVLTPLTTMLDYEDQAKIKAQFGLTGQPFSFEGPDPNLLYYDAITRLETGSDAEKRDAIRMLSAHIKALELGLIFQMLWQGPNPFQGDPANYTAAGNAISALPSRYIFNDTDLSQAFAATDQAIAQNLRADVLLAAAHILNQYARAVTNNLTAANIPQYTNGAYGFALNRIYSLFRENSAAAASRAMLVTEADAVIQTQRYAETLPFIKGNTLYPAIDFYRVDAGSSLTLEPTYRPAPVFGQFSYSPSLNDVYIMADTSSNQVKMAAFLDSVEVPARNAGELSAELKPDGSVLITPKPGFTGVTYFDYVARINATKQRGRAFVAVEQ